MAAAAGAGSALRDPTPEQLAALNALLVGGGPIDIAGISRWFDENPGVYIDAARDYSKRTLLAFLAWYPDPDTVDVLRKALARSPNPTVRDPISERTPLDIAELMVARRGENVGIPIPKFQQDKLDMIREYDAQWRASREGAQSVRALMGTSKKRRLDLRDTDAESRIVSMLTGATGDPSEQLDTLRAKLARRDPGPGRGGRRTKKHRRRSTRKTKSRR
jgi:hypothetical protein